MPQPRSRAQVGSTTYDAGTGITNFTFSRGAFQGSRGADTGEDSYIENVFEELDAPGEWFFNESTQMLYLWHNATSGVQPPADGSIVVTQVKSLFNVTGASPAAPIADVSLVGLGLRDTAYTYMDPHSIPSGGDWTLERSAVVFIENATGVAVTDCVFERVDGNAVLLSGFVRNSTVSYNEFAWIGATAVASWGNTDGGDPRLPPGYGQDGSAGNQPRGNTVSFNLCHELGIWEKQSSFWTQFKSSENTVSSNVVFNGPRAHINFNDGFRGASTVESNLLLNSCRESADHGPFNRCGALVVRRVCSSWACLSRMGLRLLVVGARCALLTRPGARAPPPPHSHTTHLATAPPPPRSWDRDPYSEAAHAVFPARAALRTSLTLASATPSDTFARSQPSTTPPRASSRSSRPWTSSATTSSSRTTTASALLTTTWVSPARLRPRCRRRECRPGWGWGEWGSGEWAPRRPRAASSVR